VRGLPLLVLHVVAGEILSNFCETTSPDTCLTISDDSGDPLCSWLVLAGACVPASDTSGVDPNCCASAAQGSWCTSKTVVDLQQEGLCQVPSVERSNGAVPSLDAMKRNANLAGAAYCLNSNSWSCGNRCVEGVSDVTFIVSEKENLACYVAYDQQQKKIVVAMRGTQPISLSNWASNFDFLKSYPINQYPQAAVHEGFWKAWQVLKDQAVSAMSSLKTKHGTNSVLVVGHSLGGAMASNAALDLQLNYGFSASVMTFGAPRAGNVEYSIAVGASLSSNWRITHNNDLVPHVPMQRVGFYHTSTEIHFPDRGKLNYVVCDGSGEDSTCANACSKFATCTSVKDHVLYVGIPISSCIAVSAELVV